MLPYVIVFIIVTYIVFTPLYSAYLFTNPPKLRISFNTLQSLGIEHEEIVLNTADGLSLDGWYIPSRNGAAVMLWHGHSGNRLVTAFHAEALAKAGFGVLMADLRAHGSSDGRLFVSHFAVQDILAGVSFLSKRADVNAAGIGVFGVGMGSTLALHAAAQTVAIRAIGVDSPVITQIESLKNNDKLGLMDYVHLFRARYAQRVVKRLTRDAPFLPETATTLPKITPRPILFIVAGTANEKQTVNRLADTDNDNHYVYLIETRLANGWRAEPDAYEQKLIGFFRKTLLQDEQAPSLQELFPPMSTLQEATVPIGLANIVSLVLVPIILGLTLWPYAQLWGDFYPTLYRLLEPTAVGVALLTFAISVVVHELLHALGFVYVGGASWQTVKFGFNWKGLAPYAHCFEPLSIEHYRITVALPAIVLGVFPAIIGLATGWFWFLLFGAVMLMAAAGDILILWVVRDVRRGTIVRDHADKAGCEIITSQVGA